MTIPFPFHIRSSLAAALLPTALSLAVMGNASAAVSLINGDFATDASGWSGTGLWHRYVVSGDGMAALDADTLAPIYTADGASGPSQSTMFTTVSGLTVGDSYEVSFDFAYVSGYSLASQQAPFLTLNPGGLQLLLNNSPIGDALNAVGIRLIDPTEPSPQTYGGQSGLMGHGTGTFTASAESHVLGWRAFEGVPSGPDTPQITKALLLLDNVSIIPIPETGTSALVILAAASWVTGSRRRKLQNRKDRRKWLLSPGYSRAGR